MYKTWVRWSQTNFQHGHQRGSWFPTLVETILSIDTAVGMRLFFQGCGPRFVIHASVELPVLLHEWAALTELSRLKEKERHVMLKGKMVKYRIGEEGLGIILIKTHCMHVWKTSIKGHKCMYVYFILRCIDLWTVREIHIL